MIYTFQIEEDSFYYERQTQKSKDRLLRSKRIVRHL